jgi:hypothetical protein
MRQVVYFNRGTKCIIRLCVSIFSLRKHYSGAAVVLQEGELSDWMHTFLKEMNVSVVEIPTLSTNISSLFRKTTLVKYLPEDSCNIYLDADTVVNTPLEPLFDIIEEQKLVFTNFANWKTSGRKISGRINEWEKVIGKDCCEKAKALFLVLW